jgi:hypothetical protein
VEEVWRLATDPGRFAEWGDRTLEVTRADSPLGIGSTYEERNAVLGPLGGRSRWTVVQHDPPHRWTHRGEGLPGLAALDAFCELRPVENATEITLGLRYRPALGAVGALVDRAYGRRATRASLRRSVDALAALAAARAARAAM